jgi:hypothetical protein
MVDSCVVVAGVQSKRIHVIGLSTVRKCAHRISGELIVI